MVSHVFLSLRELLINPNASDALDTVKANVYSDNKTLYIRNAAECTRVHASKTLDEIKAEYQITD